VVGEEAPCASRQPVSLQGIASITSPSLDFTKASWPSRTCLAVRASARPKAAAMTSFRVAGGRAGQPLGGGVRAAPRLTLAAAPAGHGNHIVRPTGSGPRDKEIGLRTVLQVNEGWFDRFNA
jgi:hypothetical protein